MKDVAPEHKGGYKGGGPYRAPGGRGRGQQAQQEPSASGVDLLAERHEGNAERAQLVSPA